LSLQTSALRSHPKKSHCFNVILWHALAVIEHHSEVIHRTEMPSVNRLLKPFNRLTMVLQNAGAFLIHQPEVVVGRLITCFGSQSKIADSLDIVLGNAPPLIEHNAKMISRRRVTELRKNLPLLEGRSIITPLVGSEAIFETNTGRQACKRTHRANAD
jgi:hypothetical protein